MQHKITNKNYKQALAKGWFADAESIDLRFNTDITSLPNNTKVSKELDLRDCTSLTSLPNDLSVGWGLNLGGCTSLKSLPDNLSVGGYLYLPNCTLLTSLPKNLSVGGYLDLRYCTSLTSLPNDLSVGWGLNLGGCTSLKSLPDNLKVKGEILLENTPFINGFVKKTDRVWFTLNEEKVKDMKTKQRKILNGQYTEYTINFDTDADEAEFVMKNIN